MDYTVERIRREWSKLDGITSPRSGAEYTFWMSPDGKLMAAVHEADDELVSVIDAKTNNLLYAHPKTSGGALKFLSLLEGASDAERARIRVDTLKFLSLLEGTRKETLGAGGMEKAIEIARMEAIKITRNAAVLAVVEDQSRMEKAIEIAREIYPTAMAGFCAVCGKPKAGSRRLLTCSDGCHERLVERLVREFGEFKRVVDAETGKAYKVPVRDILELGLKREDLVRYPPWEE